MEFNLRKARKLEAKINTFIKAKTNELDTSTEVRVNETDVSALVILARQEFLLNFENLNNLLIAKQEIRDLIAKANFDIGIDSRIAKKVLLESKISFLNRYTTTALYNSLQTEDIIGITKKQLEASSMYARSTLSVNFLNQLDKDKFILDKNNLQKEIESLEDELASLNYSTKIRLNATTAKLLQDNSLI